MLLIFDNCDEYINNNPVEFKHKLQFLKKEYTQICVVLVSENLLNVSLITPENSIYVPPYDLDCSSIFLKTLTCTLIQFKPPSERKKSKHHSSDFWDIRLEDFKDLVVKTQGNSQLLSILTLLYCFGGKKLISKVQL